MHVGVIRGPALLKGGQHGTRQRRGACMVTDIVSEVTHCAMAAGLLHESACSVSSKRPSDEARRRRG